MEASPTDAAMLDPPAKVPADDGNSASVDGHQKTSEPPAELPAHLAPPPPAHQDDVPGLSTSSSASESSAAHSPPPPAASSGAPEPAVEELDFDHPVRHVQPAFFYPTPGAVPADYYVHSRRAPGGAGSRTVTREGEPGGSAALPGDGEAGGLYLDPEEDEECKRGIPVFKPTMEEFIDFEGYMNLVDHWGRRSGIVKVIPPDEWIAALPQIPAHAIADVKIRSPIQQHMQGRAGLFRVNNVERKKPLSVKEWFEKCTSAQYRTPNLHETSRSDRPTTTQRRAKDDPAAAAGPPKPKHPNQWTYRKKAAEEAAKAEAAAAAAAAADAVGVTAEEDEAHAVILGEVGEETPPAEVHSVEASAGSSTSATAATSVVPEAGPPVDPPPITLESTAVPSTETKTTTPVATDPSAPAPGTPAEASSSTVAVALETTELMPAPSADVPMSDAPLPSAGPDATADPQPAPADAATSAPEEASTSASMTTYAAAPARKKVVALYTYRPKPIPRPPPLASTSTAALATSAVPSPLAINHGSSSAASPTLDADGQPVRRKQPNQWTYRDRSENASASSSTAKAAAAVVLDENGQPVRRKQPNQWTYRDKPKPSSSAVPALSTKVMVLDENGQLVRRKQPNQWTYRDKPKPAPTVAASDAASSSAAPVAGSDDAGQPVRRKQPNQWTYRDKPKPAGTSLAGKKLPPLVLDANGNWVKRKQPNQWTYRNKPKTEAAEPSQHASATFDFVAPPPPLPAAAEPPVKRKQPNQWTYRNKQKAADVPETPSTAATSALTEAALSEQNAATAAVSEQVGGPLNSSAKAPGSPAPSIESSTLSSLPALEGEEDDERESQEQQPQPPTVAPRRKQPNQWTYRNGTSKAASVASSSAATGTTTDGPSTRRKQPNQWTYRNAPSAPAKSDVGGGERPVLADATDGREIKPLPTAVKRKQPNQWTYRNSPKAAAAVAVPVAASPSVSASSVVADGETPVRRKQPNQWTYRESPKQIAAAAAAAATAQIQATTAAAASPLAGSASTASANGTEGEAPPVKRKQPNQWTYRNSPKEAAAAKPMSPAVQVAGQKRKQPNQWTYRTKIAPAPAPAPVASALTVAAETSAVTEASNSAMEGVEGASPAAADVTMTRTQPPATATLGEQMATIAASLRVDSSSSTPAGPDVVVENIQVDPKHEVDMTPVAAVVAAADEAAAEASTDCATADKGKAVDEARPIEETETFTSNPAPRKRRKTPPPEEELDPWYETLLEKKAWMPEGTKAEDFTEEACRELERKFWRGLGVGESAWYGADLQGSFFTEETTEWNVAALPNLLNRLKMKRQLPGVNTPYLYWGMWRAAFAWHVEDMDLYSVNYLHFGAPKFWYAVPQAKADALERTMRSYFPSDVSECDQFLRHKSFAASPQRLGQDAVRPNVLVQHPHEFVFTFPRGYHSGFNTGFNCAESINFALDSWIDLGRKARYCTCIDDSVRMDVDAILREHQMLVDLEEQRNIRAEQERERLLARTQLGERKRLATPQASVEPAPVKKVKALPAPSPAPAPIPKIVLKAPKPVEPIFPCVLCASSSVEGLLECTAVPPNVVGKNKVEGKRWFAHELCANYIPETYVIDIDIEENGIPIRRKLVDGVCNIPKDRWNLGCSVCTRPMLKKMGGKIQCDKGKCPRAFHVTCAQANEDTILHEFDHTEWVLADDPAAIPQQIQITTRKRECVCSTHNPAVKERKKQESLAKQRNLILSYKPYDLVKIRSKSGMIYEVPVVSISTERETVSVHWLDGRAVETPWSTVVDPSSYAPKPAKKSAQAGTSAAGPAQQPLSSGRPFDYTRGEQLFKSPKSTRAFISSPADLSDVDPSLINSPWATAPPAFPVVAASGTTADRRLQISPSVQRLLEKDPALQSLFLSVGWPVAAPPAPRAPAAPSTAHIADLPQPVAVPHQQKPQQPSAASAPTRIPANPSVSSTNDQTQAPQPSVVAPAPDMMQVDPMPIVGASDLDPAGVASEPAASITSPRSPLAETLAAPPPPLDFAPMIVDPYGPAADTYPAASPA